MISLSFDHTKVTYLFQINKYFHNYFLKEYKEKVHVKSITVFKTTILLNFFLSFRLSKN